MKLSRIVEVVRETLIIVVWSAVIVVFFLFLIWMTSMVADCTILIDLRGVV